MPQYLYVSGGHQKSRLFKSEEEWNRYERGLILQIEVESKSSVTCVDYQTPKEARPENNSSITFKSGTRVDRKLYVCTSTEVLIYDLPDFHQIGYVSLPCFNDLHHVRPISNGNLVVVNTGLDMVVEFTPGGEIVRQWNVLGEDVWSRFSPDVDYRKVDSTKPHKSHPNYVFEIGSDIWVTRFYQRDALCLTDPEQRINVAVEAPHDGVIFRDKVYFTTVDGHLVVADCRSHQTEAIFDLKTIGNDEKALLGWCRGVLPLDETRVWVGFGRIRKTKFQENINWVRHAFHEIEKPTHLALYDLSKKKRLTEINLENYGMHILFGVFPGEM